MLKKLYANAAAKKSTIFAAMFVITSILVSNGYSQLNEGALIDTAVQVISGGVTYVPVVTVRELPALPIEFTGETERGPVGEEPVDEAVIGEAAESLPPQAEPAEAVAGTPTPQAAYYDTGRSATVDGFVFSEFIPLSYDLQEYTYAKCVEHNLEYEMVLAVMWRESRFQVNAVGYNKNGTTDSGIMQINDINRDWLRRDHGITDLMDPRQNIAAGTAILGDLRAKYGDNGALLAYQYGENGYLARVNRGEHMGDTLVTLESKRDQYRELLQEEV